MILKSRDVMNPLNDKYLHKFHVQMTVG